MAGWTREGFTTSGQLGARGYFLARQGLGIGALALPFLLGLLGLRWLTDALLSWAPCVDVGHVVPYAIGFDQHVRR